MRDAVGGSSLLYLVIIFVTVVMIMFSSILTYSKAYKVKNRIIEIIEKHGTYAETIARNEINPDLSMAGYNSSNPDCSSIKDKLTKGSNAKYQNLVGNLNKYGYNYCVFESDNTTAISGGKYYVVVAFVEFQVPVIGDLLTFPVYGETQILGKNYDY